MGSTDPSAAPAAAATAEAAVRGLFAAFAARDADAVQALVDPEFAFWPEGTGRAAGREGRPYVGHDGVRRYFEDVAALWEHLRVEPGRLRATDGGVVAFGTAVGRLRAGPEVRRPVIWVFKLRDGRLLQGQAVATAAEAEAVARVGTSP